MMKEEPAMTSIAQLAEALQRILEEDAVRLAKETGFIERERAFNGADFAQALILGWLQRADERLEGFTQILERREVSISASGLSQRFTEEAAIFMQRLLERLAEVQMQAEEVEVPLLRRWSAVRVEDSSVVLLPAELAHLWRGCGGSPGMSEAAIKLFVRWDVLQGKVEGPRLTDGRHSDNKSPFNEDDLPAGGLYLADLGFFALWRLARLAKRRAGGKRFLVMRLQYGSGLSTRSGHHIDLRGILPQEEGEAREIGVLVGKQTKLPLRLIMVRLSEEVAKQRRERIREAAQAHGREPSEEGLYLAGWTIVVTNVTRARLSLPEALVLLRLRWQIERLFRLWKEHGQIDEWRSKKPWRIRCEVYGKLAAMLIQQWLIGEGCWQDPWRRLVKAAAVVRREANRIMVALYEGGLEHTFRSIVRCMRSGCRLERRKSHPSSVQLLLEGLDWQLTLTSCLWEASKDSPTPDSPTPGQARGPHTTPHLPLPLPATRDTPRFGFQGRQGKHARGRMVSGGRYRLICQVFLEGISKRPKKEGHREKEGRHTET
jgi:Transposase DDE domain